MPFEDTDLFLVNRGGVSFKTEYSELKENINSGDVHVGPNAPDPATNGDLWWDTDDGRLYIYYDEGDSGSAQWVDASPEQAGDGSQYLSSVEDDTAAGAITFEGRTTHETGVSVTGSNLNVGTGTTSAPSASGGVVLSGEGSITSFVNENTALHILKIQSAPDSSQNKTNIPFEILSSGRINSTSQVRLGSNPNDISSGAGVLTKGIILNSQPKLEFFTADTDYTFNPTSATNGSAPFRILGAPNDTSTKTINVAMMPNGVIYSKNSDTSSYSFYAAGSAPSYFAGATFVGSVNASINNDSGVQNGLVFAESGRIGCHVTLDSTNDNNASFTMWKHGSNRGTFISFNFTSAVGNGGANLCGRIKGTGANSVNYEDTCDYRLKQNIQPLSSATDLIKQLKPSTFEYINEPGVTYQGFVAHEIQEVVPATTSGEKDEVDDNGDPVYQGVDQRRLIPYLTKALQEALTEIDSLKARVQTLEGGN